MDFYSTTEASPSMVFEVQNGPQFEFFQSSQRSHALSGFLSSSPYRCTDSPSSSSEHQDEDEAMEMMDDDVDDEREESPERRTQADDEFTSDVDRSFNSAMSVSASPCPYPSSNGMKSIFGTISRRAAPPANSNKPWQPATTTTAMLGTASSDPSPLYKTENDRENENDDDSDYRHAQVELSPTGQKCAAKRAGMMFVTMADVPSFATKVSMMGSNQQKAQPLKRPTSTDLKQHLGSNARVFGRESAKANTMAGLAATTSSSSTSTSPEIKGLMLPPPPPGQGRKDPFGELAMVPVLPSSSRISAQAKKARPNSQGSSRRSSANSGYMLFRPSPTRIESAPVVHTSAGSSSTGSPVKRNSRSNMADAMCLDTPFRSGEDKEKLSPLTAFGDLPSDTDADDFGNLFCDSPSAPVTREASLGAMRMAAAAAAGGAAPKMGLRLSPLGTHSSSPASSVDSPSVARLAPTLRGMEKAISVNAATGGLFGSSARFGINVTRRAQPYKRPQLATLTANDGAKLNSTASALSVLQNSGESMTNGFLAATNIPPSVEGSLRRPNGLSMRRAFSVCDQANSSNAESFTANDTGSSNASSGRVLSTIETSSSSALHPMIHGDRRLAAADAMAAAKPASPFALGFGANEMDGKILPCHRVKEDGLVRITHETLRNLLDGHFDDRMSRFHIIDCRFGYEYSGGHIAGALNVNNTSAVETLLLKQGCGMYNDGEILPVPSRSGEGREKPTVVVFHCEFSNKRAPAIAKFLRSRDRTLNNDVYPKVHYPELYILEGGYCDFYDKCPEKCEPRAYVPMDDPKHETKRDSDLHDFRKFTRTRSFTYGENQPQAVRPVQPCPRLAFDAASIAANRRAMAEKKENTSEPRIQDHEMASPTASLARARLLTDVQESPGGDSLDGSPCARLLTSTSSSSHLFGSTKTRLLGRAVNRSTFMRTSSYAGAPSRG
ncbi:hypothetical protein QFC21_000556 [Naganishia friedmannii]|uniref:Uncharacterized protein n=1 Tax=Naganishia friedmannii TaxID=89922 RepID=A0ACC2WDS6_9TREE|nr:hypothetical protein QFC21_000556 [Naganishia friedmannii]